MRAGLLILVPLLIVGCMTAQKKAQEGVEALNRCDLREANRLFSEAVDADDSDPDIALAFALTDLVLLPESPVFDPVRARLGFTAKLETSFLWGRGGVLEKLSNQELCSSIEDFVRQSIAHPSLAKTSAPDLFDTLDPTLTVGELRDVLLQLDGRLHRIAQALVKGADNAAGETIELKGGCGLGSSLLQPPELYVIAGALEAVRAAVQASQAYDGNMSVQLLLDSRGHEAAWVKMANDHLGHVADSGRLGQARQTLREALGLVLRATGAARQVKATTNGAIFDWTKMSSAFLVDLETLLSAAQTALANGAAPTALPFLTPLLQVDVRSFFDRPIDLAAVKPAVWSLQTDTYGSCITDDFSGLEKLLGGRFNPDPFASGAPSFRWSFPDRVESAMKGKWEAVFNPENRWSSLYECR